jgi:hypothetical protein
MDVTTGRRKQKKPPKKFGVRDGSSSGVKPISLGRHQANCMVCAHEHCADIEVDFVN